MNEKSNIFFHKNEKDFDALRASIEAACESLIYVSETDSPVEFFDGGAAPDTQKAIAAKAGTGAVSLLSEVTLDTFFDRLTTVKDWFGDTEKERAKKFLELRKLLEEGLLDLKVFRVGRNRVDIYVAGMGANGRVIGIMTSAVET